MEINLSSLMKVTRLGIRHFRTDKAPGIIVNITSMAAEYGTLKVPLYHAAKWGVSGFTRSMATLEKEFGIRVVAVSPGMTRTPLWEQEDKKVMIQDGQYWIEPKDVALGMTALVENTSGGNADSSTASGDTAGPYPGGTILEILKTWRIVPLPGAIRGSVAEGGTLLGGSNMDADILDLIRNEKDGF